MGQNGRWYDCDDRCDVSELAIDTDATLEYDPERSRSLAEKWPLVVLVAEKDRPPMGRFWRNFFIDGRDYAKHVKSFEIRGKADGFTEITLTMRARVIVEEGVDE